MKAVLLNSGGVDSRVAAAIANKAGYELHSIYIDCNPLNRDRALPAAQRTADLFCVSHEVLPFPSLTITYFPDLPGGLPYSSIVMFSVATAYCKFHKLDAVISGTRTDMWTGDWLERFKDLLACHKKHTAPLFFTPIFALATMDEVVAKAKELDVPLEDTTSCGRAVVPCGCFKCQSRTKLGLPNG